MKTSTKIITAIAAALTFGAGSLALAHPGPGGMEMRDGGGHGHMRGAPSAAEVNARLTALKADIGILPSQEAAWQQYEGVVRQLADARRARHTEMQTRMPDPKTMSEAERITFRESMKKQHDSDQATRDAARQALYAALSPEQKAKADKKFASGHGHRRGHHHATDKPVN